MIKKIKSTGEIEECVKLHKRELTEGIFYRLDDKILRKLYALAIDGAGNTVFAYEEKSRILGVAVCCTSIDSFVKRFMRKYRIDFFSSLLIALIKDIRILPQLFASSSYSKEDSPEVLFLFTGKDYQGKGIGSSLLHQAESYFSKNEKDYYRVIVNQTNKKAINFYIKYGFKIYKQKKGKLILRKMIR